MRASAMNIVTYREDPADAEVASHRLLQRAGLIHKSGAGRYLYTPLMWRVLRKIEQIIREEMDRAGALEVQMPILQDRKVWEDSGRWDGYVKSNTMFTLRDRRGAEMCLGPTHEEIITDYARSIIRSHKQLPVNYYQIHTKFRDEIRPRFGLMRVKEFLMKDAYSFDADQEGLDHSYDVMARAYHRLFARIGLETLVVDADSGDIGGTGSQEFMIAADVGEDAIIFCASCGYSANSEKASSRFAPPAGDAPRPMHIEETPNIRTVDELVAFFPELSAERMVKTIHYTAIHADREQAVVAMIRGDQEINEIKLLNVVGGLTLRPATEEEILARTGAEVGFAGPIGLQGDFQIVADLTVQGMTNVLCGVNQNHRHALDVNFGRDCPEPTYADFRLARAGEGCPRCGQPLGERRGIEVGHIFKLGTKYSAAMGATFLNAEGKSRPLVMGCYGIGVSRIAAAAIEQSHDRWGCIWPISIAPYEVIVIPVDMKKPQMVESAEQIYRELQAAGIEVVLDDRAQKAGPKFKDADLIGFPFKIVAGRGIERDGTVELKHRVGGETEELPIAEAIARVIELVKAGRNRDLNATE